MLDVCVASNFKLVGMSYDGIGFVTQWIIKGTCFLGRMYWNDSGAHQNCQCVSCCHARLIFYLFEHKWKILYLFMLKKHGRNGSALAQALIREQAEECPRKRVV
jgi:hypothetical protein